MKNLTFIKSISTIFGMLLFLLSILISPVSFAAGAMEDFSPDDIVAELKPKLELNDQQVKDLTAALGELGKTLHTVIEKQEAAKEEGDSEEFIKSVKQAQADYQKKLKGILNDKQLQTYNELKEAAIMDMMKDLAEIKLLDIQPKIGFSDDQLEKMVPVMAESMRGMSQNSSYPDMYVGYALGVDMDALDLKMDPETKIESLENVPKSGLVVMLMDADTGFVTWVSVATGGMKNLDEEIQKKRLEYTVKTMFEDLPK